MNDEAGFLEAIAAHRDDETHLLVFADWLEDRGDPRGQWIRNRRVRQWMGPNFESPVPALLAQLAKKRGVMEIRRVVRVVGAPIVPGLVALLKHEDWYVRTQAAVCLAQVGPGAKEAVPALIAAMKDTTSAVRKAAAAAVRDIGADESAGTETLRDALTDTNYRVRREAAKILGAMGAKEDVLEELTERLKSDNPKDRIAAVQAVGQLETAAAAQQLGRILTSDPVVDVRKAAADQFGRYTKPGQDAVIEFLRQGLADRSPQVRLSVLRVVQRMPGAVKIAADVIRNLTHKDAEIRRSAAYTLGVTASFNDEARDALVQVIGDRDQNVAEAVVTAFSRWESLPRTAVEPLLAFLPKVARNRYSREYVLTALGKVESPPESVIRLLRNELSQPNQRPHAAINALGAIGPPAAAAIPDLAAYLRQDDHLGDLATLALVRIGGDGLTRVAELLTSRTEAIRNRAVTTLRDAGPAALPLLPTILKRLGTAKEDWRQGHLVTVIASIGPAGTAAIPELLKLAAERDRYPNASANALRTLGIYGEALVPHLPALAKFTTAEHRGIHSALALLFTKLAHHTTEVLEPLRDLLRVSAPVKGENFNTRWAKRYTLSGAATAVAILGPAATPAVPELTAMLDTEWTEDHRHAVAALVATGSPTAVAPLRKALESQDQPTRARAAEALGKLGHSSEATLLALVRAVEDRVPRVRREAIDALGRLKTSTPEVLASLRAACNDTDNAVRTRATIVLKKLAPKPEKVKKKKSS